MIDENSYKQIVYESDYLRILTKYQSQFENLAMINEKENMDSKITKAELINEVKSLISELTILDLSLRFKKEGL